MKKVLFLLFAVFLFSGLSITAKQRSDATLSVNVTDNRKLFTHSINKQLLLRVVKESNVSQKDYGWRVEVVRKPYKSTSRNLLYHSRRTLGAHPSQIYVWHVGDDTFPNERTLEVHGYPYVVRVALVKPVVEGEGADKRFTSGEIKITWERK